MKILLKYLSSKEFKLCMYCVSIIILPLPFSEDIFVGLLGAPESKIKYVHQQ